MKPYLGPKSLSYYIFWPLKEDSLSTRDKITGPLISTVLSICNYVGLGSRELLSDCELQFLLQRAFCV